MAQQAETWIFVAVTTGSDLYSADQSGELTTAQAEASAEQYMDAILDRIEAEYPDADIEVGAGNGIDSFRVTDDHGREDEIREHLRQIVDDIWSGGEFWVEAN
jgi:hypothetical protein